MPTSPQDVDAPAWRPVFPPVSTQPLHAAWGLTATDLWLVGGRGAILHHDGHQTRPFASPTRSDLIAIDGADGGDLWAAGRHGEILRWDGRRWLIAHVLADADLHTLCVPEAGDVLAGGVRRQGGVWSAAIWRRDGSVWLPMTLPDETAGPVLRIWRPALDQPLMAATPDRLLFLAAGVWQALENIEGFDDAASDLVLLHLRLGGQSLGRLRPGGLIDRLCFWGDLIDLWHLARSRRTVIADRRTIYRLDGCRLESLAEAPFAIHGLVVPQHPGPDGAHLFAFGEDSGLIRLAWRDDGTAIASDRTPPFATPLTDQLAGDGQRLLVLDRQGRLLGFQDEAWRQRTAPWPAQRLLDLPDGSLILMDHDGRLAASDTDADWRFLPDLPAGTEAVWFGAGPTGRAMVFDHALERWQLWGLGAGAWSLLDTLPGSYGHLVALTGAAPDDLYLLTGKNEVRWLLHHDGAAWREVFPDRDITVRRIAAGRRTGALYLEAVDAELGSFSGLFDGSALTVLDRQTRGWDELVEIDADRVFCRAGSQLYRLAPQGWLTLAAPTPDDLRRIWAQADQGLFVLTERDEIFHRDLATATGE